MSGEACTRFVTWYDEDDLRRCRCPACKGFLPRGFPLSLQFQCRKCGAVLETLPSIVEDPDDEEDRDYEFGGRICLVPSDCVTIQVVPVERVRRVRTRKTNKWAMGDGFARRVWIDKQGDHINIDGERIEITDPRIKMITEDAPQ